MSLKFIPPVKMDRFALAVGNHFQTYKNIGIAKLAWHARKYSGTTAHILENIDGEWYIRYTVEGRTDYKDLPWIREIDKSYVYGYSHNYTRYTQARTSPEEYAAWRLKVEYERLASLDPDDMVQLVHEQSEVR